MSNKSDSRFAVVRFRNHSYDFRPNRTPLSPITVIVLIIIIIIVIIIIIIVIIITIFVIIITTIIIITIIIAIISNIIVIIIVITIIIIIIPLQRQTSGGEKLPERPAAIARQPPDGLPPGGHPTVSLSQDSKEIRAPQQAGSSVRAGPTGHAQPPWATSSHQGVGASSTSPAGFSVGAVSRQEFGTKGLGVVGTGGLGVVGTGGGAMRGRAQSSGPGTAYMNSYSVSLAYAQLSQQQQMQQMQQQMLLQQQQLILQQQELMRQQQLQREHESEQARVTALVEQLEQHKKQLAELEDQLKIDKEGKETETDHPTPAQGTLGKPPEQPQAVAAGPAAQGAGWAQPKIDMDHLFEDFSKRQLFGGSQSRGGGHEAGDAEEDRPELPEKSRKAPDGGSLAAEERGRVNAPRGGEEGGAELGQERVWDKEKEGSQADGIAADGTGEERKTAAKDKNTDGQENGKDAQREQRRKQEIAAQIEQIKELQKQTQHPYEPRTLAPARQEPSDAAVKPDTRPANQATDAGASGGFQAKLADKTVHPPFCRQFGHCCGSDLEEGGEVLHGEELVAKMSESLDAFQRKMLDMKEINPKYGADGYTSDWKVRHDTHTRARCPESTKKKCWDVCHSCLTMNGQPRSQGLFGWW